MGGVCMIFFNFKQNIYFDAAYVCVFFWCFLGGGRWVIYFLCVRVHVIIIIFLKFSQKYFFGGWA